jgi:hypothetical protein
LSNLQSISKWNQEKPNGAVGGLLLIKEDNLPPLKWELRRILKVSVGSDSKVRVVILKTKGGHIKKRLMAKVCKLPIEQESTAASSHTHSQKANVNISLRRKGQDSAPKTELAQLPVICDRKRKHSDNTTTKNGSGLDEKSSLA